MRVCRSRRVPMDLSSTPGKIGLAVVVLLAVGLIYFLWTKSVPPEPVIPAGQSISNPTGEKPVAAPPVQTNMSPARDRDDVGPPRRRNR
jgi:hypothetical protein